MAITHAMASTVASDATTTLIRSTDWNSNHVIGDASVYSTQLVGSSGSIVFGRATAGAGAGTEFACTTAGRDLLDDAAALNQRATLGLGAIATKAGYGFKAMNFLTSTAGTFAAGSGVSLLVIEAWGGGGGGGGVGSTLAANSVSGGGGGSGGYGMVTVTTVTTSGYAYVCGTGGSGGTTLAKGTSGGISTWTSSSGVRLTVNGGGAGSTMATGLTVLASAGGGGAAVGSGGDVNLVGQAGDMGIRLNGTLGFGGNGGAAPFAPGANGIGGMRTAGTAAIGYACGGGGGQCTTENTACNGGVGTQGLIIVTEYY